MDLRRPIGLFGDKPKQSGNSISVLRETINNQNDVGLLLAKHVFFTVAKNKNTVLSPLSIQVLLGLIAADCEGPALDQLLTFLKSKSTDHFNSFYSEIFAMVFDDVVSSKKGTRLLFANGVWIDKSISLTSSFKEVVDNVYKATYEQVDFKTQASKVIEQVNQWVKRKTNGLIQGVLPPESVNSLTRLILGNAIYFRAAWSERFNPSFTKDCDFYLLNGNSIRVPFMTSKKDQYISCFNGFKALRLSCIGEVEDKHSFSMYFLLPDAKDGLAALMERVSSESRFLERHLPYYKREVGDFRIPKFKISFGFQARDVLRDLGVELIFSDQGNLTAMVDSSVSQELYVSDIIHKSSIEVNEEGAEAAAVSFACISFGCAFAPEKIDFVDFVADHPFLFFIREDKTGVILFIGQLLNPLLSD